MKVLKSLHAKQVYAERLFGMAVGLFLGAILLNNSHVSRAMVMTIYTLITLCIVGSLTLSVVHYFASRSEKQED
jgi:fucose permease